MNVLRPRIRLYADPTWKVHYAHVVNRSQYRPDAVAKRELDAGNTPGATGMYDGDASLQCGDVPNEVIWLREGRMTYTEEQKMKDALQKSAIAENEIIQAEVANKANTNRMDNLLNSLAE